MASDSYLQIDGVKGESTDSKHKDWIEITAFYHEISQPSSATASTSGGASTGRSIHGDFVVTKEIDISSPKIYQMCSSGKAISKVVVNLMRASGDAAVLYLAIEMDQVMISKVEASVTKDSNFPTEEVSFNYGTIKWTYTQQKRADGTPGGNMTGGWDLTANKAAA